MVRRGVHNLGAHTHIATLVLARCSSCLLARLGACMFLLILAPAIYIVPRETSAASAARWEPKLLGVPLRSAEFALTVKKLLRDHLEAHGSVSPFWVVSGNAFVSPATAKRGAWDARCSSPLF